MLIATTTERESELNGMKDSFSLLIWKLYHACPNPSDFLGNNKYGLDQKRTSDRLTKSDIQIREEKKSHLALSILCFYSQQFFCFYFKFNAGYGDDLSSFNSRARKKLI